MITSQQLLSAFQNATYTGASYANSYDDDSDDSDGVVLHIEALTMIEAPNMSGADESWHGGDPEPVVRGDEAVWELELLAIHTDDEGEPVEDQIVCHLSATNICFAREALNFDLEVEIVDEHKKVERCLTGKGNQHIEEFKQRVIEGGFWIQDQAFGDLLVLLNDSGLIPNKATD